MTEAQIDKLKTEAVYAYPIRPWSYSKVDAGFLSTDYRQRFGNWHRGIDLNGVEGGDTDLGYPVQSMFPGRVVGVQDSSGFGKTVLVRSEPWVSEHVLHSLGVEGDVIDVMYTHLHTVTVSIGDPVDAGDHLGSIGKGGRNQYVAHLHLEIRRYPGPVIVPQGSTSEAKQQVLDTCLDPETVLRSLPFSNYGNVLSSRRQVGPVRLFIVNGTTVGEDTVVAINSIGGKLYARDSVKPRDVSAPSQRGAWDQLRGWIQSLIR